MIKKKISIVLCGLALSASMSYGNVVIAWIAAEGFFITPPGLKGLLIENGVGSTLAQLIWAGTDNVVNGPALVGGGVQGDDLVLDTFTITFPGNSASGYADGWAANADVPYPADGGSMVYARVFQDPTIDNGDLYYDAPLFAARDTGPPAPPQSYQLNTTPAIFDGDQLTLVVVPEPTSLAFMLIGFLSFGYARVRKKLRG
ncbi:MAG: PEP-CTERM sorting domain-containing protein [Kiritimatiellae bacterium]|nr:PEP-CTERM sorting domain-containing protein [Kiritimatiellia bacterium]